MSKRVSVPQWLACCESRLLDHNNKIGPKLVPLLSDESEEIIDDGPRNIRIVWMEFSREQRCLVLDNKWFRLTNCSFADDMTRALLSQICLQNSPVPVSFGDFELALNDDGVRNNIRMKGMDQVMWLRPMKSWLLTRAMISLVMTQLNSLIID